MSVKYSNLLTDENLRFAQKLASSENVDCVAINTYSKDTVVFYKNGVNIELIHSDLQRIENWVGGLIVYKILGQGQPIPEKQMSEYRQAKANTKFK